MLDDIRGLAIFDAVADAGSFSAAAKRLKLSTSVVSQHVSKLESRLGVTLILRSTRSLSLTPEGEAVRDAARRMVAASGEALDALSEFSAQPVGSLRIALPAFGSQNGVNRAIWSFAKAHPMVAFQLSSSEKTIDLVREGFDLAIRMGKLADSSLRARRIGTFQRRTVAAPAYLEQMPPIETVDDLKQCEFISLSMVSDEIALVRGAEQVSFVPDNIRLEVDSVSAGCSAVLAGLAVQVLPLSEVEGALASGRLVEVLPEWRPPDLGTYAVWPDMGAQKRLTRKLIDHLVAQGGVLQ